MLLESLELDNFKSFGNRKKIIFRKGFTVVSGPNGSGKSNIGDSLLFVLGIRSSKAVRADRLADLIHKASNEKKNRNYCSVTVAIDTEDANSPPEQRKIILKRELVGDIDGIKSNYYINGSRARHTDVENLLDSLHIYLDSYSFVLQGDINNIVKMTGFERRKLLESISGIESFDQQIEKAKTDITTINENLGKLEVLTEQTRIRREQLEIEKRTAEKYLELIQRVSDLRKTYHFLEIEGHNRELRSYSDNLVSMQTEISNINNQISEQEKQLEGRKKIEEDLKKKLEVSGNSQLNEIRQKIEDKRVQIAEIGINIENITDRLSQMKGDIAEGRDLINKSHKKVEWFEKNRGENSLTLAEIRNKIQEKSNELRILKEKSSKSSSELFERQEKIRLHDQEIKELTLSAGQIQNEKEALTSKRSHTLSQLGTAEERRKDYEFQIRDSLWRLKEIEKEVGGNKKSYEDLNARYYELKNSLDDLRKRKDTVQQEINRSGREQAQLQASSSKSGQSNRPLSTIMNARTQSRISGIHGTIRELITFDEEFRVAVEASAGSRLNAVVVEDDGVAEKCLDMLRMEKSGKLTFLPINKVVTGRPRGKAITVRASEGARGYVFEKVKYDSKYEGIIWYAFQDTVIVEDVKAARRHMVGVRLVTMGGDIFEASGAITGGYVDKSRSSVDVEQKLSQLGAAIREYSLELEELNSKISLAESEFETVSQRLRTTSRDEGSRNTEIQQLRKRADDNRLLLDQTNTQIEGINGEMKTVELDIKATESRLKECQGTIAGKEQIKSALFDEIRELSPQFAERETNLEETLSQLREKESEFSGEITRIDADIKHLKERIEESETRIATLTADSSRMSEQLKSSKDTKAIQSDELGKLRAVEAEISEKSKEIVSALNQNEAEISRIHDRIENYRTNISAKREIILSMELKIENIQNRISEIRTEMDSIDGKVLEEKRSMPDIKREMEGCNRSLAELGPVNQKAIEDFAIVAKDLETLVAEVDNLNTEKAQLEKLTEKLNEQKKHAFLEMYHAINTSMKEIYREISGGGEAHLEMSNESDPLNTEVHIRARPKGTNFSKIEALSGGEKSLTALSFILAVQRINPSPVYYLDEVDMFLDGANAERVGKMFRANSYTSQVLAVSLRKAMLKYADNVIGVTSFDDENTEVFEKYVGSDQEAMT